MTQRVLVSLVDHVEIEPDLPQLLETIERLLPAVETVHARLDEYVEAQRTSLADCDVISGELYKVAERAWRYRSEVMTGRERA